MKAQAHISEEKIKEVSFLKENLEKYKVIAIADLTNLPSAQLESLKAKIKDKALIRVSKKRLLKIAISRAENKDLTKLVKYLENCIPALIFTNEDSFKISNIIKKNRSNTFAKPGQISPIDITIEPGPTNFPPGPIIGELGQAGIIAAVESGKVTIKKEARLVNEGDVINKKIADVLIKLGIEPIEIGLNIVAAFQDGIIYERAVLDIDEETYLNNIKLAYLEALSLSFNISYVTKENINLLIKKAAIEAKALATKQNIFTSDSVIEELQKAEIEVKVLEEKAPQLKEIEPLEIEDENKEVEKMKEEVKQNSKEAKSEKKDHTGYSDEAVKIAQDLLSKLQDEKAKKLKIKKEKGLWD